METEGKDRQGEGAVKMEAEFTGMLPPPRNSWSQQKLAGAPEDSLLELQREYGPANLNFRLLASKNDKRLHFGCFKPPRV